MQYKQFQHLIRRDINGLFSPGIVVEVERGRVVVEVKDGREVFNPQHETTWMDWSNLFKQSEEESRV